MVQNSIRQTSVGVGTMICFLNTTVFVEGPRGRRSVGAHRRSSALALKSDGGLVRKVYVCLVCMQLAAGVSTQKPQKGCSLAGAVSRIGK